VTDSSSEPTVVTLADPDACALAAAERIVEVLDVAIDTNGEAHWVTTGGSSAAPIYRHLAHGSLRGELDWRKVSLWFTDERFVPIDHPKSNAKVALDDLVDASAFSGESGTGESGIDVQVGRAPGVRLRRDNVHIIPVSDAIAESRDTSWAAARYAEEIRAEGPDENEDGLPAFDLILLGVGPDGHILSVFPGSSAFDTDAWVVGVPAPTHVEPYIARVTLNPRIVTAAHELLVVTTGEAKASTLRDVLRGEIDVRQHPAQLARRAGATWIIDRAAASLL
jgi:6-phosphogluconolactonase